METYTIHWPQGFEDYAWQLESKGWFSGLKISIARKILMPTFYDQVRLSQDVAAELSHAGVFCHSCIIVVDRLSRSAIETAISDLAKTGALEQLLTANTANR